MSASVPRRAVAVFGLLVVLAGLVMWYGTLGPAPALGAYPDTDHLAPDYEHYLGDRVTVSGQVVDTAPVTIRATSDTGNTLRLTVTNLAVSVTEGEQLRVYGVAEPDHTVRAINAFTVPPSGQWYAWGISFLAGLWVLVRLVRYWRIERTNWTLQPRAESRTLRLLDWLRSRHVIWRDRDA